MIDAVFQILFARERRLHGGNLRTAWETTWYRLTGYVALGGIAAVALAAVLFHWATKSDVPSGPWQVVAGGVVAMYVVLLRRRWRRYLANPPALRASESKDETSIVFRFRAAVVGGFILSLVLAGAYGFVLR
jgi:hypothetical protein